MRVTIVRDNFGGSVTHDIPEVPQVGDCIDLPEFKDFLTELGTKWVVFRRMWFPEKKAVKIYVQEE